MCLSLKKIRFTPVRLSLTISIVRRSFLKEYTISMTDGDYTLLVDETGIDGVSARAMYVGCLIDTEDLKQVEDKILGFNKTCLEDPYYSGKPGLVNSLAEVRHFAEDNESLRSRFIEQVIHEIPCRVYAIFDVPKKSIKETKVELFKKFIGYVMQVREIKKLNIIVEKTGSDDKYLIDCGAVFKDKSFLPLCIADYYGAILHRFHEKRIKLLSDNESLREKDLNGLAFNHYSVLLDRISLELDLSTNKKSSRKDGRYFFKQIEGIVCSD